MKAVMIDQFGPPSVLTLQEVDPPKPKDNEVLIRVKAAGINPIDYKIRNGSSRLCKELAKGFPVGLGFDLAGEVVEVGSKAPHIQKGDHVFGVVGFPNQPGCYQECRVASPKTLGLKPDGLSFEEAASLGTAATTAYQVLEKGKVQEGSRVLIHAGAGGVGHLAIQIAKAKGAYVITTASKEKHAFVKGLGADEIIDYRSEDFTKILKKPVDFVVDLIGGEVGKASFSVMDEKGYLITVPTAKAEEILDLAKNLNKKAESFIQHPDRKTLDALSELVLRGKIVIEILETFPLEKAPLAHELLEGSKGSGKLVFSL